MDNIVVFASGSGTNFQAIIDAVEADRIKGRIRGLIASKPGIRALERAEKHRIETKVIAPSDFESDRAYEKKILDTLDNWDTDLAVLAGYMLKIPSGVLEAYEGRMINIHPSLLPKYGGKGFYGRNVHQAVLDNGEAESGCTVHYVTEEYDRGPIIEQVKVPVYTTDDAETLAARVLEQEHELLPRVIDTLLTEHSSS